MHATDGQLMRIAFVCVEHKNWQPHGAGAGFPGSDQLSINALPLVSRKDCGKAAIGKAPPGKPGFEITCDQGGCTNHQVAV